MVTSGGLKLMLEKLISLVLLFFFLTFAELGELKRVFLGYIFFFLFSAFVSKDVSCGNTLGQKARGRERVCVRVWWSKVSHLVDIC